MQYLIPKVIQHFSHSSSSNSFLFTLQQNGLFIIATTSVEVAPLKVYYILVDLVTLISNYIGDFTESLLNQHFDVVIQLLEEYLDEGMPYITDPALLKLQIPPPSLLHTVMQNAVSLVGGSAALPSSMLNSASSTSFSPTAPGLNSRFPWRVTGLKYAHNEIFFDVVEELDCIVDE